MGKKQLISVVSCLLLLFSAPHSSVKAQVSDRVMPSVDIQTSAEREVMPDELVLSISINESDYKGKVSLQEKQQEMIDVLKLLKIDYEENLTINQMGSSMSYKLFSKNPNSRTSATYQLKLNDAVKMQLVIQSLEAKHISNIDLVYTRYTKADELKTQLGIEAIKKAKAEAQALAQAIGQDIGKAFSINYWMQNNRPQPRMYKQVMQVREANAMMDTAESEFSTPAITGIRYTVNVSVRFELK